MRKCLGNQLDDVQGVLWRVFIQQKRGLSRASEAAAYLMASGKPFHGRLTARREIRVALFGAGQARRHFEEGLLDVDQSGFQRVGGLFVGRAGHRCSRALGAGVGVAVDQGVAGSAALDFAQAHQVASFEAPVAVLEFPEGHVWSAGVEDVVDCAVDERAVLL